jgi:hypothetical protein
MIVEQILLVLALVGACALAYRLTAGGAKSGSCHSGGECGCGPEEGEQLVQIAGRRDDRTGV